LTTVELRLTTVELLLSTVEVRLSIVRCEVCLVGVMCSNLYYCPLCVVAFLLLDFPGLALSHYYNIGS
jgi:hypothetical protein